MEDRNLGINLIIDGISYPLTIKASEEPYYRQAARMVNDALSLYKKDWETQEAVKVITMVALDIAFNSIAGSEKGSSAELLRRIDELTHLVDNALKENE